MGANGSTAASCSSLDLTNSAAAKNKYHYHRNNRHQQYLHDQKLLLQNSKKTSKYLNEHPKLTVNTSTHLKQASSHFDLTSSGLLAERDYFIKSDSPIVGPETYNLTNADMYGVPAPHSAVAMGAGRPMLMPGMHGGARKSNAGVASRILQQRQQQQRSCELKKFSDSLPSLNNIMIQSRDEAHHHYHQNQIVSNNCHNLNMLNDSQEQYGGQISENGHRLQVHKRYSNQQVTAAAAAAAASIMQQKSHNQHKQRFAAAAAANTDLVVNKSNDSSNDRARLYNHYDDNDIPRFSKQLSSLDTRCSYIKRATSLSSLHDLNQAQTQAQQQHHNHHQPHNNRNHQKHVDVFNPSAFSNNNKFTNNSTRTGANHPCHRRGLKSPQKLPVTCRPESSGNCVPPSRQSAVVASRSVNNRDLEQQKYARNNNQQSQFKSPPPPPVRQHSQQSNQQLSKKSHKYKQATNGNAQSTKNNRYKSRLHNQEHLPHQQGCPVLPPLPRSQSLHELIQLRATENGQRMRTTGTLRGPFGASEPAGKVNLVAELLESRRLQRQNTNDKEQISADQKSETMLSQSSSTDDGIHDVSITAGDSQHSASRSQSKQLMSPESSPFNHRYSTSSHDEVKYEAAQRQRIFKKQPTTEASRSSKFSQKSFNDDHQRQDTERKSSRHDCSNNFDYSPHHKSTLKRSVSHSALQQSCSNSNLDSLNQDGDESDDLNELAKFLYQFKQRQLQLKSTKVDTDTNLGPLSEKGKLNKNQTDQRRASASIHDQVNANFQQSPNSTTSSSGFASSTCTSHSISSSDGTNSKRRAAEFESISSVSSRDEDPDSRLPAVAKPISSKKYPAPPRPDDIVRINSTQSDLSKTKKCLISGKLKLSSSLLSIVDEYQSTLRSENRSSPLTLLTTSNSNLTSVLLLGEEQSKKTKMMQPGTTSQIYDKENDEESLKNQLQGYHLERLRKYTQSRQISQSELALNHLTSSSTALNASLGMKQNCSALPTSKSKLKCKNTECGNNNNNLQNQSKNANKTHSNRLFNLIRRISDKTEITNNRAERSNASEKNASKSSSKVMVDGCRGSVNSAGGHYHCVMSSNQLDGRGSELDAIDQIGVNSSQSNECGQKESTSSDDRTDCMSRLAAGTANDNTDCTNQFSKAKSNGLCLKNKSAISESLCDLNFDCDLELIKSCRSTDEGSRQNNTKAVNLNRQLAIGKPNSLKQNKSSDLNKSFNEREQRQTSKAENWSDAKKRKKQNLSGQQQQQLIMNSSKREHNWRLEATSSVIKLMHSSSTGSHYQHQHVLNHDNSNSNNNSKRAKEDRPLEGGKSVTEPIVGLDKIGFKSQNKPSADQKQQQQGQKSKWLASSWLLGGSNGKRKTESAGKSDDETRSSGKSYLSKLISSSGTPESSGSSTKSSRDNGKCDNSSRSKQNELISEADQLLVELDHSLDLVSGSRSKLYTKNMTVPWWQQVSNEKGCEDAMLQAAKLDALHANISLNNDSDDEYYDDYDVENDDADYASINRAIINETFDVDLREEAQLGHSISEIKPGSPSNSFTFSAPNSPVPSGSPANRLQVNSNSSSNNDSRLKSSVCKDDSDPSQLHNNSSSCALNDGKLNKQGRESVEKDERFSSFTGSQDEQKFNRANHGEDSSGGAARSSKFTDITHIAPPGASNMDLSTNGVSYKVEIERQKYGVMGQIKDDGNNRSHNLARSDKGVGAGRNESDKSNNFNVVAKPIAKTDGDKVLVRSNGKMKTNSSTFTKPHPQSLPGTDYNVSEKRQSDTTEAVQNVACEKELGVNDQKQNDLTHIVSHNDGQLGSQHCVLNRSSNSRVHNDSFVLTNNNSSSDDVRCKNITPPVAASEPHVMSKYHPNGTNGVAQNGNNHDSSDGATFHALNEKINLPRTSTLVDQTKKQPICDDHCDRQCQPKHLHAIEQRKKFVAGSYHNNRLGCEESKDFRQSLTSAVKGQGAAKSDDRLIIGGLPREQQQHLQQQSKRENSINHSMCSIHGQSTCCACCCVSSNNNVRRGNLSACNDSKQRQKCTGNNNATCNVNLSPVSKASGAVISPKLTVRNDIKDKIRNSYGKHNGGACCNGSCVPLPPGSCENEPLDNGSCSCCNSSGSKASPTTASTLDGYRDSQAIHSHKRENDKLIIQKSSRHCCSSPASNKQQEQQFGGKKLAITGNRQEFAQVSSSQSSTIPDEIAGVVKQQQQQQQTKKNTEKEASRDGKLVASRASPAVTYYHYSHEMGKFAPTNGHQQVDAMNERALVGNERESDSRNRIQCSKASKLNGCSSSECTTKDAFILDSAVSSNGYSGHDINSKTERIVPLNHNLSSEMRHHNHNHHHHHHDTNHSECQNEDVKLLQLSCCSQNVVRGSNLSSDREDFIQNKKRFELMTDNRPRYEIDESERIVTASNGNAELARACCSSSHPPTTDHRNGDCHCFLSSESTVVHRSTDGQYCSSSSPVMQKTGALPNGQVAACLAKFQAHHLATAVDARCNPICRSNSELVMLQQESGVPKISRTNINDCGRDKRIGNVLFGKLRSSLLYQRNSTSKLVASSQLSLLNCHDGPHLVQNMLLPGKRDKLSSVATNEFDENFILKRKTPNAGLKSRC